MTTPTHTGFTKPGLPNVEGKQLFRSFAARVFVFLLLFCLAGLSTLAKDGVYFHRGSSRRYYSISSKMNMPYAPAALDCEPSPAATKLAVPDPPVRAEECDLDVAHSLPRFHVVFPLYRRPPPAPLS